MKSRAEKKAQNLLRLVGAGWNASIGYQDSISKDVIHTGYHAILHQGVRGEFDYLMTRSGKVLGPVNIAKVIYKPQSRGTEMKSALLQQKLPYISFHEVIEYLIT